MGFAIYLTSLFIRKGYYNYLLNVGFSTFTKLYSAFIAGCMIVYLVNYGGVYLLGPINFQINQQYPAQEFKDK